MQTCEYSNKCWRYSYSKYLLDHEYQNIEIPTRFQLLLKGYANAKMIEKYGSLYCECFPRKEGFGYINLCNICNNMSPLNCHERIQEQKRVKIQLERKSQLERFPDARRRLFLSKEIRCKIAKKCRYKCIYCNRVANSWVKDKNGDNIKLKTAVDHIIPIALGGTNAENNLALSCSVCNRAKSTEIWAKGCRIGFYI